VSKERPASATELDSAIRPGVPGNGTEARTAPEVDVTLEAIPARRRYSPFYAFSFRNFRLYFYGQSISVAGTWMQSVAQSWLVWQLTHDARWLGIVNGASAIPFVLFAVWGGQIADRCPRRNVLVWTQGMAMVLAFILAALATNRWVPIQAWHIAVVATLSSIVNAFNMPAQQAFITDMVDDREALGNAIALNSLRFNLSRVIGPVLAGLVLVKFSVAACFALNGLSFLAVIQSLLMMRLPPFVPQERHISVWEGFGYIRRNRKILRVVMLVGVTALFAWPVSTLFPVFASLFHKGARGYSWLISINGIGAALGGLTLAALGHILPRRVTIYGGAILFCVALLLLSVAPTYSIVLACLTLSGFAMITLGISCNTEVQEDAPDALRGRVMAVYSLVFNGLFPLGGLEVGFLAGHLSAPTAVRLNATLGLGVVILLLLWSLAERRVVD
jgi:MFS family permease